MKCAVKNVRKHERFEDGIKYLGKDICGECWERFGNLSTEEFGGMLK